MGAERGAGSKLVALVRTVLWALAIAFVVGLVIGTLIRIQLEEPELYMGAIREGEVGAAVPARTDSDPPPDATSARTADPRDIGHTLSGILVPRDHEKQV